MGVGVLTRANTGCTVRTVIRRSGIDQRTCFTDTKIDALPPNNLDMWCYKGCWRTRMRLVDQAPETDVDDEGVGESDKEVHEDEADDHQQ